MTTRDEAHAALAAYDEAPRTLPDAPLAAYRCVDALRALLDETEPTPDEREALFRALDGIVADGIDHRDAVDAVLAAGFHRQGSTTDAEPEDSRRLVYEVKMMLSSVASHGPAALTTTDDRMYTANLLRRLGAALEAAEAAR